MDNNESKAEPFDMFIKVYKMLGWLGFYKLLKTPKNQFIRVLHKIYIIFACVVIMFFYIASHVAFVVQMYNIGDIDHLFEGLMTLIPSLNQLAKILFLNLGSKKLDKLNKLMQEPIFGATNKDDEEYFRLSKNISNKMFSAIINGISFTAIFWGLTPVFKRLQDENALISTSYALMDTKSWKGFWINYIMEIGPTFWVAYGHLALDFVMVMYYYQAVTQLKIIKYNLENLVNDGGVTNATTYFYKDEMNPNIEKRFIYYVNRYERVVWFTQQANEVFNKAISFQLFAASFCTCFVVFRIGYMNPLTIPFGFLIMYFIILNTQVFLYCYFGDLVISESATIGTSLYLSDWTSLSPRLRRQLLVAMARWSQPIVPQVTYIIVLSLTTFVAIIRAAYALFTLMNVVI